MSRKLCIILTGIILTFVLCGCSAEPDLAESYANIDNDNYTKEWYDEVIDGFGQENIRDSMQEASAVAEYRILYDQSLLCYNYYSLQVFEDGTGQFKFMIHYQEDFETGEMIVNETRAIDKSDTKKLVRAINRNDFWNIPTVHPDEDMGCDGKTVFVEGCADGNTHFISMWEPEKKYGIYKIFDAFRMYSRTIAENPFD